MILGTVKCIVGCNLEVSGINQVPGSLMGDFGLAPVLPAVPDVRVQ